MSNTTIVRPTLLGDALRRLGDLLDGAPSIETAADPVMVAHQLDIYLASPDAVRKVAEDLALPSFTWGGNPNKYTEVDVKVGPVTARIFARHMPERELHRPVDVTLVLEAQADAA